MGRSFTGRGGGAKSVRVQTVPGAGCLHVPGDAGASRGLVRREVGWRAVTEGLFAGVSRTAAPAMLAAHPFMCDCPTSYAGTLTLTVLLQCKCSGVAATFERRSWRKCWCSPYAIGRRSNPGLFVAEKSQSTRLPSYPLTSPRRLFAAKLTRLQRGVRIHRLISLGHRRLPCSCASSCSCSD